MNNSPLTLKEIEDIFKNRKPKALGLYRYFSILVPLVEKDGEIYLLYEVRSDDLKTQPGEVCFPGGAMEKNETKRQCALRETCEELGLRKKDIRVVAELDTLYTYSNFTMYCYLGVIDYEAVCRAKINKAEVKEIFLLPLKFLSEEEPYIYNVDVIPNIGLDFPYHLLKLNNGYNWRKGKSEVPIYKYKDRIVWGLTARITHNFANFIKGQSRE